jgi:hypothetical protein
MIPTEVTITRRQYKQPQQHRVDHAVWLFILASSDCHFRGDHAVVVVYIGV